MKRLSMVALFISLFFGLVSVSQAYSAYASSSAMSGGYDYNYQNYGAYYPQSFYGYGANYGLNYGYNGYNSYGYNNYNYRNYYPSYNYGYNNRGYSNYGGYGGYGGYGVNGGYGYNGGYNYGYYY
jgi:hypothetical protein